MHVLEFSLQCCFSFNDPIVEVVVEGLGMISEVNFIQHVGCNFCRCGDGFKNEFPLDFSFNLFLDF